MQAHLATHSFAELLRFEIRKDPLQLPEEQRLSIVRDVYQHLLGEVNGEDFKLGEQDSHGVYSIAEALGSASVYRLWSESTQCWLPNCTCRRARDAEPLVPGA